MDTAMRGLIVLMGLGLLAAAEPSGPALLGVPLPPIGGPAPTDALPAPRTLPAGPPREEPAPAPREQIDLPNGGLVPPPRPHEEAAPMPHAQTPPPPRLAIPGYIRSAPPAEVRNLHQEIEGLRLEREAMLNEQMALLTARDPSAEGADAVRLRRRITELLSKAARASKERAAQAAAAKAAPDKPAPSRPATPDKASSAPLPSLAPPAHSLSAPPKQSSKPDESAPKLTDAPIDPLTLAQTLFLAGDHEAALKIYRQLEKEEQKAEDRVTIQYMTACCLRKLGKTDESSMLFREVANSGGNEVLVENAQWYLRSMKERRELQGQLEELRQRRQTVTPRKP